MFLGHHYTQLKDSNRIHIRQDWRKLISDGVYLTQGFDKNILLLTPDTFQEIHLRISELNIADPLVRLFLRMFLGTASFVENIENETISLPTELMGYASLETNVVMVGQGDYVEVWSADMWQQQEAEIHDAYANSQRFSAFNISIAERES